MHVLGSSFALPAHGWVGTRATLIGGAFHKAKYEKLRRRKSEGGAGRKRGLGERNSRPARAKFLEVVVGVFLKISSNFFQ